MHSKATAIIAGMLLLGALGAICFTLNKDIPTVDHRIYTSLGYALAQETATATHDRGQVVAIIPDAGTSPSRIWREQWQAFTEELNKHPQISLATRVVGLEGSRVLLQQIVDQNPQVAGIVFLAGPLEFDDIQALSSRQPAPKLILLGNSDAPPKAYYTRFFATGVLAALILPRPFSDLGQQANPATLREWFEKYYRLYTPQNSESLPE